MTRKILLVEDMIHMQTMIREFLETQGYSVLVASEGAEAFQIFEKENLDLILLDIMMPGINGFQFLTQLRKKSSIPVVMVTAKQQEMDIIRGFETGADDYIVKPFRLRELLMRIRAVLKRIPETVSNAEPLVIGDIILDRDRRRAEKNGETINLTPIELFTLETLALAEGKVVTHAALSIRLIENGFAGTESTLKIHIRNIRVKIGDDAIHAKYIETIFGVGYRLMIEDK